MYNEKVMAAFQNPQNVGEIENPDGIGTVISANPLAGTIRVILKDDPDALPRQYHRDDVTVLPKEKKNPDGAKKDEKKDEKK